MRYRRFGRTGWQVSEVGYGMWGLAAWSGSDDAEVERALHRAVELGCNFFDTAWAYGEGRSERILGALVRAHQDRALYVATKVPPRNGRWPALAEYPLDEAFPADHIRAFTERSLANLGTRAIDLLQFHVWTDAWAGDARWQRAIDDLKREGLIGAAGISVNRWEPENVIQALRTGLIDAVQVVYNIFDQAPEDVLFPACRELDIGVIARVPFDEGTLTGTLTRGATWPAGDWRNIYFGPENLGASVARAEALRPDVPAEMSMPELALRFILSSPDVDTVIPGMRRLRHVEANLAASDAGALPAGVHATMRRHRWDRRPAHWSR